MKKSQASITAEGVAFARAHETTRPEKDRISNDTLARAFIRPWFFHMMSLFMPYARWRSPGVLEYLCSRCRFIDDTLQECLKAGFEQVVVLGAGLDSRPYRFHDLAPEVRYFEVDHPATQAAKLERLRTVFAQTPAYVTYVAVDFMVDSLAERLSAAGYDPQRRTLFIWEGVIYYLSAEAVDQTLAFVAKNAPAGSAIVFDYVYSEVLNNPEHNNELCLMRRYRGMTGEGLVFGIGRGKLAEFMKQRGFEQAHSTDTLEIKKRYFTGANAARPLAEGYALAYAVVSAR